MSANEKQIVEYKPNGIVRFVLAKCGRGVKIAMDKYIGFREVA